MSLEDVPTDVFHYDYTTWYFTLSALEATDPPGLSISCTDNCGTFLDTGSNLELTVSFSVVLFFLLYVNMHHETPLHTYVYIVTALQIIDSN